MQGTISFDGTLSGGITGGGGGGSEVTITPTLQSGTKIADYEIDSTPGELYAPTPPVVPEHIVTDIHGFTYTPYPRTEIARYTIDDGVEQSLYGPDFETTWEAYPGVDQDYTVGILRCYGSTYYVKIPYYQKPLTAGTNITIDPVTNTISASGGSSWNYSTTEVDTGQKWIDGKTIYCRVFEDDNRTFTDNNWNNNVLGTSNITILNFYGFIGLTGYPINMPLVGYYRSANEYITTILSADLADISIRPNINAGVVPKGLHCTIFYTKNS